MQSIFKALCLLFFTHSLLAQCSIGPLQLNNQACDANGMYMIELDFTYNMVGSQGFVVYSSYTIADTFQYADLPVMVGPIPGYCNQGMDFWVEDIEIGGQCSDIVIPFLQCCINSGGISGLTIDTLCDANGDFAFVVDFVQNGGLSSNFNIYLQKNGHDIIPNQFNTQPYSNLPVTLDFFNMQADCMSEYDLLVFDSQDWSHTDAIYGMNVCCAPPPCSITSFTADIDTSTCIGEIVYVNFDVSGTDFGINGYTVSDNFGGSQFYLQNSIKQYIVLSDCVSDYILTITDETNPACTATVFVGTACCPCEITNIIATPGVCSNGVFDLEISFNPSGSCLFADFEVQVEGATYPMSIINNGYVASGISAVGQPIDGLLCSTYTPFECFPFSVNNNPCFVPPVPCDISSVIVDWSNCESNGQGDLYLTPVGLNLGNSGFTVTIDGVLNSSSTPTLGIDDFYSPMDSITYTICSNSDTTCCFTETIDNFCYSSLPCSIDIISTDWDVFGDTCLFYVFVDTIHTGPVTISINDSSYLFTISGGSPGSIFYTFEDLDLPTDSLNIEVCSISDPTCCSQYTSWNPCASLQPCDLMDVTIDWSGCDANGRGDLNLTPSGINLGDSGFTVTIDGVLNSSSTPTLGIDDFYSPMDSITYTICSNSDTTCCFTETIDNFCYSSLPCSIDIVSTDWDVFGDTCLFYVFVDTIHTGPVTISINDSTYLFTLSGGHPGSIFYTFEDLDLPTDSLNIEVCSISDSTCCSQYTSWNPCFTPPVCSVDQFTATFDVFACSGDTVFVDFDYVGVNFGLNGYRVIVNQTDTFHYSINDSTELYVLADCNMNTTLLLQDNDDPNCSEILDLGVLCCAGASCIIDSTVINSVLNQGAVDLQVLPYVTGNCSNSYYVFVQGDQYGPFAYEDEMITIEGLTYEIDEFEVQICDAQFSEICESQMIENILVTDLAQKELLVDIKYLSNSNQIIIQHSSINLQVFVFGLNGRVMLDEKTDNQNDRFDLPDNIPNGVYAIMVRNKHNTTIKKIVILQ